MAKRKLSEFLKEQGVNPEDLEDDELGMDLVSVRKGYRTTHAEHTKATQRASELERQLQEHAQANQRWGQWYEQNKREQAELQRAAETRKQQVESQGGDWRRDPLFMDIAREFDTGLKTMDRLEQGMRQQQAGMQAIAKGVLAMHQHIGHQVSRVEAWAREREIDAMKGKHADFDTDKVREYAEKHGISSWQGAYDGWKGSQAGDLTERAKAEGRDEGMREAEGRVNGPPMEMGGGRAAPSIGSGANKDYDSSWKELTSAFKEQGIGSS